MLGNRKLIVDTHSEIYSMIKDHADETFWNFEQHVQQNQLVLGAVYVIGREQSRLNSVTIQDLINSNTISVVYSNPTEGSEPMEWNLRSAGFTELLTQGQMLVVTGGDINPAYPHILYENFLGKVHDYDENIAAIQEYANKQQPVRPYKFLFLNGRMRGHRKELIYRFKKSGLIDQSLWTNLDDSVGVGPLDLDKGGTEKMCDGVPLPTDTCYSDGSFPVQYLPAEYEVEQYRVNLTTLPNAITGRAQGKYNLFQNDWGEIYLNPRPYLDTYFSLVTETVFDYPCSFRTEKIWKPIAIGHPFIVASNAGYYRDLHNLGFRTFGHLIDESFDTIDNNRDRCNRIVKIVENLCGQDLPAFITAAEDVCKYNQQLIQELRPKIRSEFPERFFQAVNKQFNE
jgi:hypothetical protein